MKLKKILGLFRKDENLVIIDASTEMIFTSVASVYLERKDLSNRHILAIEFSEEYNMLLIRIDPER